MERASAILGHTSAIQFPEHLKRLDIDCRFGMKFQISDDRVRYVIAGLAVQRNEHSFSKISAHKFLN